MIATQIALPDSVFELISNMMKAETGQELAHRHKYMVECRLQARLRTLGIACFADYFARFIKDPFQEERLRVVDLLTTHETYFFREPQHFDYLAQIIVPQFHGRPLLAWSAASSTGEEAYSIAMVLAHTMGCTNWEVLGTDVSADSINKAGQGVYGCNRLAGVPSYLKSRYLMRGVGEDDGRVQVSAALRERVHFQRQNLANTLCLAKTFDVIFLRNVLIYFEARTQVKILNQVISHLNPGGWLILGNADNMCGAFRNLESESPGIFRKESCPVNRDYLPTSDPISIKTPALL